MTIKKILLVLMTTLMLLGGCSQKPEETRATWISYIDYTQILWGKSEAEYRNNVDELLSNLEAIKINTIYVHASAFTDAYYPSKIYPAAQYVSGTIGEKLSFDPFGILLDKAKSAGFEVEAWINPLRSFTQEQMNQVPDSFIQKRWIKEGSTEMVYFNQRWYLNPASEEVQNTITAVVEELLENYELDGIHMDDYFYPDGVNIDFDQIDYLRQGNGRTLAEFRKDNVNQLIEKISETIKRKDQDCRFTVSPAGNIQYTTESIYGDVVKWIREGWIDQVIPQIYFGFEHQTLPYDECLKQWESLVEGTDVKLIPGLAAYKINTVDNYAKSGSQEWIESSEILSRQVKLAKEAENYQGFALYSYHSIYYPEAGSEEKVWDEIEEVIELVQMK